VFLALSRSSLLGVNKLVVIKRLRHFAEDEARSEARQMFLNEARLATLLNHPNIVQTNDVGVEDGHMYLTMEYLEGQPLNAITKVAKAKRIKLDDKILLRIISDALAGLHYAHELPDYNGAPLSIVHRDLSPHNIFVTYEGVVKIVDFGIAKSAGSSKTEAGIIKGKFAYMAPEQASDDKIDLRADVFAMGIVLWELLTGERLVYRRNDVQTVHRLVNETFLPPSSVRPEIVPELDAIVMKALAKDRSQRYQSAREMREALEEYMIARSHPVRQEEIGPLISHLFKDERSLMRERIRKCIATAPDDGGVENLPAIGDTLNTLSSPSSRPTAATPFSRSAVRASHTPGAVSGTLAATIEEGQPGSEPMPSFASKKGRIVVVAIAVAAMLMVAFYAAVGHLGGAPDAPGAAAAPEKIAAPSPAPEPAPTTQAPVAAVNTAPPPGSAPVDPPAATPAKPQPARRWVGPSRYAPPQHAATIAPPPPAPAPPPPPPPAATATATTHPREFNTAF
jgi:serine/threonine protein kinase